MKTVYSTHTDARTHTGLGRFITVMIFRKARLKIVSLSSFLHKVDSSIFGCPYSTKQQHFLKGPSVPRLQASSSHCHAGPYCAKQASRKPYFVACDIQRNHHNGYTPNSTYCHAADCACIEGRRPLPLRETQHSTANTQG